MSCTGPITHDAFLDWWAGELPPAGRRQLEEHLLSCDACSTRARAWGAVAEGVLGLLAEGDLPAAVLPSVVERLRRDGRRLREYRVAPGGGVHCTVGPDDDVVLARLAADLGGVTRVDLVSRVDDGPENRVADLPFDPSAGEVILAPSADDLRARPRHVERLRLLAVSSDGERLLGEYIFDHTPWPGLGGRA